METYLRRKSYKLCSSDFRSRSPGVSFPSKSTQYLLVNKFRILGSLLKKNSEQSWCVFSKATLDDIGGHSESTAGKQWKSTQLPFIQNH
jgi:hypothetical protein